MDTQFVIDHADQLSLSLREFKELLDSEWPIVLSNLSNLNATWHDDQRTQFDVFFEGVISRHQSILIGCENNINEISSQIEIVRNPGERLGPLGS